MQHSVEIPLGSHQACATGTLQVLDAARKAGVRRVVYAGSASAYGIPAGDVQTEADPLRALSPYAAAKLAGEFYCQSFAATYGLETVVLRFFNIFGPRQRADSPYSGVIALFTDAMLKGQTPRINGDGLQSRDFTYVGDVVQALTRGRRHAGGRRPDLQRRHRTRHERAGLAGGAESAARHAHEAGTRAGGAAG